MEAVIDTPLLRKVRGAFFTPPRLAEYIANWAVRTQTDRILEPSCGDAVFLSAAASRLSEWSPPTEEQLVGYDIHERSLAEGAATLRARGLSGQFHQGDFFNVSPSPQYDAVIGNPPFIRFQGFSGASRAASLERALSSGVNLSGLASSWAAFVVHASTFLKPGGRMGLVLPAELLSVNYAAPVREYLLKSFGDIELLLFEELVFPGIQAEVVVVLADRYGEGSTDHFNLFQTRNLETIGTRTGYRWRPPTPAGKWTDALITTASSSLLAQAQATNLLVPLSDWGTVSSGTVTGANNFFTITPSKASQLGLSHDETRRLLPSGVSLSSAHDISLTRWQEFPEERRTLLFYPTGQLSKAAAGYVMQGEKLELDQRYKCKVRSPWWRVPLNAPPSLFVSYMSGSTPRVVGNTAELHNLNSTHGLQVPPEKRKLARRVLPLLSLTSYSLLSAELVGRTYGGGILKLEPREASRWLTVSESVARQVINVHSPLLARGHRLLKAGDQEGASEIADELFTLVAAELHKDVSNTAVVREARSKMLRRRLTRGQSKS